MGKHTKITQHKHEVNKKEVTRLKKEVKRLKAEAKTRTTKRTTTTTTTKNGKVTGSSVTDGVGSKTSFSISVEGDETKKHKSTLNNIDIDDLDELDLQFRKKGKRGGCCACGPA